MSQTKRRRVIAGNWKMFKTQAETRAFFSAFLPLVRGARICDIVVAPPFTSICAAVEASRDSGIAIGGQDVFWEKEGAFTGEISPPMLVEAGCRYVIIGHSERRQFFGETEQTVAKKTKAAVAAGLTPIVCVGELLEHREAGRTEEVCERQFLGGPGALTPEEFSRILVAYEPVGQLARAKRQRRKLPQRRIAFCGSARRGNFPRSRPGHFVFCTAAASNPTIFRD